MAHRAVDRGPGLFPAAVQSPTVRTKAAVLVPVYRDSGGELRVVVVRRSDAGVHGGQLAFPGGKLSGDEKPLAAALREAEEEIGLSPDRVAVLAELPAIDTMTSGYRVTPFLARVREPGGWRPDETEVAEVLDVRLSELARPENHDSAIASFPTWPEPREIRFYRVGPHRLWGLTYRILQPLIPRLLAGEWRI